MLSKEASVIAQDLFDDYVLRSGYGTPYCYAELQDTVLASGCSVLLRGDAPRCFAGIQIGDTLYINGTDALTDNKRMQVLAHEWCHYLRRGITENPRAMRMYAGLDQPQARDYEELIAREFEKLF